jgi:hypothetical protein
MSLEAALVKPTPRCARPAGWVTDPAARSSTRDEFEFDTRIVAELAATIRVTSTNFLSQSFSVSNCRSIARMLLIRLTVHEGAEKTTAPSRPNSTSAPAFAFPTDWKRPGESPSALKVIFTPSDDWYTNDALDEL